MSGPKQVGEAAGHDAEEIAALATVTGDPTPHDPAPSDAEPHDPAPDTGELRKLLRHRAGDLTRRAVRRGAPLADSEIEEVENLARLLEIRERLDPKKDPSQRRFGLVVGALIVLLAVASLLLSHQADTVIALDARAFEVGFELAHLQELTDGLSPVVLSVTGLAEARLPRARGRAAEAIELAGGGSLRLRAGDEAAGAMTLAPLVLTAGSTCRLLPSSDPRRLRLALTSDALELGLVVHGVVRLDLPGDGGLELEMPSPRRLELIAAGRQIELDLRFATPPRGVFPPQLEIAALDLIRIDEIVTSERTLVRHTSTLAGGTLYYESLDRNERALRRGEMLRFADARGFLHSLEVAESPLRLDFHGRVKGMTTSGDRSLMPRYLEYLRQHYGLKLLWGAMIGLLVFAQGFLIVWQSL